MRHYNAHPTQKTFYFNVYRCTLVKEKGLSIDCEKLAGKRVTDPEVVAKIGAAYLADTDREHMVAIFLNSANKIIGLHTVSTGILNASLCHPREVFKAAILANAASLILMHNHPSGEVEPSAEDKRMTRRLVECAKLMDVPILDHIIVNTETGIYFSFREAGLIEVN